MRKLAAILFLSLAIELLASDTYVYPPGLDSAIQHWQYPSTVVMNTDFGFYAQDIGKIAFNQGDGGYYYLSDPAPTWIPMATGGGGGSTTFLGLIDTPSSYSGAAGQLVAVNSTQTGLIFQTAAGGGNVSNSGTPTVDQTSVWVDATHIKGVSTLRGGLLNQVLGKLSGTDYDWGWTTVAGGGGNVSNSGTPATDQVSIWTDATHIKGVTALTGGTSGQVLTKNSSTPYDWIWTSVSGGGSSGTVTSISATTPIVVTPNPVTITGTVSLDPTTKSNWDTAFTDRLKWDGGATGLNAATGRASLGATTIGGNVFTMVNPVSTGWFKIGSTGTVIIEDAVTTRSSMGVQAQDADLDAISALAGTNTIYYRSGAAIWTPVAIGSNMTFTSGTLAAGNATWDTGYSERRQWDGGSTNLIAVTGRTSLGATTIGNNIFTASNPLSTSWMKAGITGTIAFEDAPTTRTSLGLAIGTNVQAWDADLDSLAALATLNVIPYHSAISTWAAATIGSNLTFTSGTLAAGNANWDTAFADRMKWDGAATGLVAATGRASLALDNLTNDRQTQAAIVPNTAPTQGQVLVGFSTGSYLPRTISGTGATVSLSNNGVLSISAIPNATLNNSAITIGAASATALGGSVSLDALSGAIGATGLIKRAGAGSVWAIASAGTDYAPATSGTAILKGNGSGGFSAAVAGTDYKVGTQNTVNVVVFTSSVTYTVPAGVTALYFEGVGGGGGGGGINCSTNTAYAGGGGGGGGAGYAAAYIGTPVASYSITIGGGGGGGSGNVNGNAGGNTTVGTVLVAGGGGGGGAGNGGYFMGLITANGGNGGAGVTGTMLGTGNDGGYGFATATQFQAPSSFGATGIGGNGGGSQFAGGARALLPTSNGNSGAPFGGGGSGASAVGVNSRTGGAGAAGVVRVWEIY